MQNLHYRSIPDEVIEQANLKADEIKALLAPYVLPLTADQRKGMLKMGERSLSFVDKAFELARINPTLRPAFISVDDLGFDLHDVTRLRGTLSRLQQLTDSVDDTMMVSGSEAYNTALTFYTSVKAAARQNIQGSKAVYEELKKRFPGKLKGDGNKQQAAE
ncbi:MAG: hypothetical protein LBV26_07970 [Bacteroidales bacterium]|jgi:hypothetical protein|nr:hypothetical protein [Bacteroidales bacterium]